MASEPAMTETEFCPEADAVQRAQRLLDERYAGLRRSAAEGWYAADRIPQNLRDWSALLGPLLSSPGRTAELGCGAGNLALDLAGRGWSVVGFDVSPEAIGWARERAARLDLPAGFAVRDLGVPLSIEDRARFGGAFDLVIDADVLHYVLGDRRAIHLANARDLLAPGGRFAVRTIVSVPEERDWPMLGYDPSTRTSSISGVPMTYHGEPNAILDEMRAAEFTVVQHRLLPKGEGANDQFFAILRRSP